MAKAIKYDALHNSKADALAAEMKDAKEKCREAEERVDNLSKENEKLQQLCQQLQDEMKLLPAEA